MTEEWYYTSKGKKTGPISAGHLKELASNGTLQPTDLLWKPGIQDWFEAKRAKGLFSAQLPTEPPPVPKDISSAARVSGSNKPNERPTKADPQEASTKKDGELYIWNPSVASSWSVLFTPAFGSYLHSLNWRALGKHNEAKSSLIWFYISLAIVLINIGVVFVAPNNDGITTGIALWFLIIWYFASGRKQGRYVKNNLKSKYLKRGWGKPLLFAFTALIGYILLIAIALFPAIKTTASSAAIDNNSQEASQYESSSPSDRGLWQLTELTSAMDGKTVSAERIYTIPTFDTHIYATFSCAIRKQTLELTLTSIVGEDSNPSSNPSSESAFQQEIERNLKGRPYRRLKGRIKFAQLSPAPIARYFSIANFSNVISITLDSQDVMNQSNVFAALLGAEIPSIQVLRAYTAVNDVDIETNSGPAIPFNPIAALNGTFPIVVELFNGNGKFEVNINKSPAVGVVISQCGGEDIVVDPMFLNDDKQNGAKDTQAPISVGSTTAPVSQQPNVRWLVGTWALCEDSDNGPKESIRFDENGTGFVSQGKIKYEFTYQYSSHTVVVLVNVDGRTFPYRLSVSTSFDRLSSPREDVENTYFYVRADGAEIASCSVK